VVATNSTNKTNEAGQYMPLISLYILDVYGCSQMDIFQEFLLSIEGTTKACLWPLMCNGHNLQS
jgi:hypothetical protein